MICLFLKQYRSWLFFLITLQLLMNLIVYVDKGFQVVSLLYMNCVWVVAMSLFLLWRYLKDAKMMNIYVLEEENYVQAVQADYEQRLSSNTEELQQQKLMLLERQDELLAWVHEMKSPMTALQLLTEQIEDGDMKERFEAEWLRLYLLLDQQLHATRLMTIAQDNRMEQVALKKVLVQEIKALRSWCFDKKLSIELDNVDRIVITDRKWLAFIVRQVLSNAVKYSAVEGEIKLFTQFDNDQLVLVIEDNGVGIKKEDLPRVFRKSYTGTIGRETSAATGMGLYLAKQAADSLNIKLIIESTETIGTNVKVLFPKSNQYYQTLA
ncbi:sensor histidine kinase [Lysinibacillus sp. 2017]|uniref:sensor histidine kinase n=1 Tax=unclassified Lysinibacillus TaxID=2636778 RepID=UPI000D526F4D|nr:MULTISPECIES: sensor histidine kinase [unclassified Lysinibacillus]AWE09090.1 sensor histidine kinase [Lysinibacillus sp. 2017]TGN35914.1 HAMP domain-containing histidine kinase [Lysinibacillus sp. S2017]